MGRGHEAKGDRVRIGCMLLIKSGSKDIGLRTLVLTHLSHEPDQP